MHYSALIKILSSTFIDYLVIVTKDDVSCLLDVCTSPTLITKHRCWNRLLQATTTSRTALLVCMERAIVFQYGHVCAVGVGTDEL